MASWYWLGLLGAGAAQVIDGLFLYRARGRLNTGSAVTGMLEFAWLTVSVFALLTGRATGAVALAAIAYVSYNLAGIVQGAILLKRCGDIETFAVPQWMVAFSIAVGFAFAATALVALFLGKGF